MVTIGMNYKVKDSRQIDFVKKFNDVLRTMSQIPEHLESHLYRDVNDACSFLIVSEWEQRQAFDDFVASDTFEKVIRWGREGVLAEQPRHRVYEQPHSLAGHAG